MSSPEKESNLKEVQALILSMLADYRCWSANSGYWTLSVFPPAFRMARFSLSVFSSEWKAAQIASGICGHEEAECDGTLGQTLVCQQRDANQERTDDQEIYCHDHQKHQP